MDKRKQLRDHVEFLATKSRKDCPFAASVLRALAGAMELDIDKQLSEVVLDWMIDGCRKMDAEIQQAVRQAVLQARDRRRRAVLDLFDANADLPPDPIHN